MLNSKTRIPATTCLFNKRQIRIITALDLTEAVVARDSIEQEEVISPLV